MYQPDERDRVIRCDIEPHPSAGAPMPIVLAEMGILLLAYETAHDGEGVVIHFDRPRAHYFGPPNDEAFEGHPLASRGLGCYGIFEVVGSSWVRELEEMNRVHPNHNPRRFDKLRHFIFMFHDNTFEVIAEGVKSVKTCMNGWNSLADLLLEHLASSTGGSSPMS
jgi:hypothetical protein